jgi:hypothetical protein
MPAALLGDQDHRRLNNLVDQTTPASVSTTLLLFQCCCEASEETDAVPVNVRRKMTIESIPLILVY